MYLCPPFRPSRKPVCHSCISPVKFRYPAAGRGRSTDRALVRLNFYIASGCGFERRIVGAAKCLARLDHGAGMPGEPTGPIRPPTTFMLGGVFEPCGGVGSHLVLAVPGILSPISAPLLGRR